MYFGFFQIPTTMNFYEENWHESLLLRAGCLLHCSSFTTTVVNLVLNSSKFLGVWIWV
jgi:hypothetical protein